MSAPNRERSERAERGTPPPPPPPPPYRHPAGELKTRRPSRTALLPLVLSKTIAKSARIANSLGIEAHVRGTNEPGRGLVASSVLIDDEIWPPSEELLDQIYPVLHSSPDPQIYHITRSSF